ncbi:MAG: hypothetical protein JWO03_1206 [Bacteroidetes bacterium]|nr:hypothetical protein [Bacteroidota bacterium]
MKKPIIFILNKGQAYQSREDLDRGEIQLNTGMRTALRVIMKEGDQDYKLAVITSDPDGSNPILHNITMDNARDLVKVKKYKNISFLLVDGTPDASYTFEMEFANP